MSWRPLAKWACPRGAWPGLAPRRPPFPPAHAPGHLDRLIAASSADEGGAEGQEQLVARGLAGQVDGRAQERAGAGGVAVVQCRPADLGQEVDGGGVTGGLGQQGVLGGGGIDPSTGQRRRGPEVEGGPHGSAELVVQPLGDERLDELRLARSARGGSDQAAAGDGGHRLVQLFVAETRHLGGHLDAEARAQDGSGLDVPEGGRRYAGEAGKGEVVGAGRQVPEQPRVDGAGPHGRAVRGVAQERGGGRVVSNTATPAPRSRSPASPNGSGDSMTSAATRVVRKGRAVSQAWSSTAVLPIPGSPTTNRAPPCPASVAASNPEMAGVTAPRSNIAARTIDRSVQRTLGAVAPGGAVGFLREWSTGPTSGS